MSSRQATRISTCGPLNVTPNARHQTDRVSALRANAQGISPALWNYLTTIMRDRNGMSEPGKSDHNSLAHAVAAEAPTTRPIVPQERNYYSNALGRIQPYACFMPENAERSSRRYPLLILLHGVRGGWRDWGQYTRLARYLATEELIVVCPDAGAGWYTNAIDGGERREDDIVQDLLPSLDAVLPLLACPARAICGLSMGGFGAVKLALKYRHLFSLAISHSGAFDVTARPGRNPIFGDADIHASFRRQENPAWLAEQALCRPASERPEILLDCGASDPLIDSNRRFSDHLNFIGYGHTYREMPGHHTWPYWNRAFRTALPEIIQAISPGMQRHNSSNSA